MITRFASWLIFFSVAFFYFCLSIANYLYFDVIQFSFERSHPNITTGLETLHLDPGGLKSSFSNLFFNYIYIYILFFSFNILVAIDWVSNLFFSFFFMWSYHVLIWFIKNWFSNFFCYICFYEIISILCLWSWSLRVNLV
jgi:hypothetical protein